MIAEHSFVTTLSCDEAMLRTNELLQHLEFSVHAADGKLTASRGRNTPAKAKRYDQLPQKIEMHYDRGKCVVAASIMPLRRADELHRQILLTILYGLDDSLAKDRSMEAVLLGFGDMHQKIEVKARKYATYRKVMWGIVWLFIGLIVLIIVAAIYST